MRNIIKLSSMFSLSLASPQAFAHVGHIGETAGHSHWFGLAAIGAVAVLALLVAKSADKKPDRAGKDADSDTVQS